MNVINLFARSGLIRCNYCMHRRLIHSSGSLRKQKSTKDVKVAEDDSDSARYGDEKPRSVNQDLPLTSSESKELPPTSPESKELPLKPSEPKELPPIPSGLKDFKIGKEKSFGIAGELWGHKALEEEPARDGSSYEERFFKTRYDTRYKDIIAAQSFMRGGEKDKDAFIEKCEKYQKTITKHRHGQVEFIYGVMVLMKEYGVHKDLSAYKALMDVFPKEVMKPQNQFQAGFWHFHKQSRCAVDLLSRMEFEGVEPDMDMEKLVIDIFSRKSAPWRKVARQIYWFGKFRNANPFPIPEDIDNLPALELAKIALKRMCPDLQTSLTVMSTTQIQESLDKTWIVSAQSPSQKELIEAMTSDQSLYVEGSYQVWLKDVMISYFVLKTDHHQVEDPEDEDLFDVSDIKLNVFGKSKSAMAATQKDLHRTSDGVILGIAATGTSSRDSVLSWVRLLEATNPKMKILQTIFKMKAPTTQVETINEPSSNADSTERESR